MYKNHISLSGIIDRLLKNPILEDLSEDDAISGALDCIALIGTISMFESKVSFVDVEVNRGHIPADVVTLNSVRYVVKAEEGSSCGFKDRLPMRPAQDPYHLARSETNEYYKTTLLDLTYSINGNFIYTSFEEGRIELSYSTLMTNEGGELMLPDDINVIKAVESYIMVEFLKPLWMMGKIQDKVFSKFEQDYDWYVAKARTSTRELSLDERSALSSMLTTLVDNRDHRGEFFQNITEQEYKIRHK